MRRGRDRERDIIIDLKRVGRLCEPTFDVLGEEEAVKIFDRRGRLIISGKIDGQIRWNDGSLWPLEVKSWSPFLTDRIESFGDLYENKWTWSGAHQLLAYQYAKGAPMGLLVLDRPGLPRLIAVSLEENLQQMEEFMQDAESCVDHIEAGTLPDFIRDISECRSCPLYGAACQPPTFTEGAAILTDPELEAMLERREELKGAALEYDDLDDQVKKQLRGVEQGIAGKFAISGRWGAATRYEFPDEATKAQYQRKEPQGKFTLSIEKIA